MRIKISKILIFSVVLLLIIFASGPARSVPVINFERSSKYLDHGKGHRFVLAIDDLTVNNNYILMVANNTNDAYNISFSAQRINAEIHVDYAGSRQDIFGNDLCFLELIFVEGSTIHFVYYIELKFDNTLTSLIDFILQVIVFSLSLFLGGILVIFIARKF